MIVLGQAGVCLVFWHDRWGWGGGERESDQIFSFLSKYEPLTWAIDIFDKCANLQDLDRTVSTMLIHLVIV